MGASSVASQRPLPLPETQSTRYPNYAPETITTIPSDSHLGARPASPLTGAAPRQPSLTPSSISAPPSSNFDPTRTTSAPSPSVLTPSGAVSDGYPPSGHHSSNPHTSQAGGPSLYYSGHMTGSWPTPGLSQPPSYTYGNANSGGPGSGPLAQPPYRAPTSYASASSPSHQHFPGRASSSTPNSESLPAPQQYHDQSSFPGPVGAGGAGTGGGGNLGSPLNPQGGSQQSGLAQPMLGNPNHNFARQTASGQSTQGGPATAQDGNSYRPPPTPSSYYPQSSGPQQPSFSSYSSQPSPTTAPPVTSSGSVPRGPSSIPAMAPPLQYPSGRHTVPPMASYASYSPTPSPVMTNIHHPGTPLALMGAMSGMGGMPGYNHHPGLSPHHPHHLYVHHPGGPPPQSERPFKCTECQQAFNRNHDLKRHQRIHLEIKPYACEDCGKRFSRKDALKRHRLVKGCGGTSPPEGTNAATGGSGGASDDRDSAMGGDKNGSPTSIKKES